MKQVYTVTPQQVSEMAKKHLQDERALIVIVGDRKVIEEQVKGLGDIVDNSSFPALRGCGNAGSNYPFSRGAPQEPFVQAAFRTLLTRDV